MRSPIVLIQVMHPALSRDTLLPHGLSHKRSVVSKDRVASAGLHLLHNTL